MESVEDALETPMSGYASALASYINRVYELETALGERVIAKFYRPEELVGRNVAVVANLRPATICGIESQGMILASGEETIRVVFLSDDTPPGERIR